MSDFTPISPWLKADQFEEGEKKLVTIKSMTEQEVGADKEVKWVMTFKETEKKIVLGKTMLEALTKATGTTDSEEVVGKKITLFVQDGVRNPNGGTVSAVRISPKPVAAGKAAAKAETKTDSDLGFD